MYLFIIYWKDQRYQIQNLSNTQIWDWYQHYFLYWDKKNDEILFNAKLNKVKYTEMCDW